MKLPNFVEFDEFNALREKMATDKLGYFELFDPVKHLTGSEKSELEKPGLLLQLDQLRVLPDKTLAIKNSRVVVYNPNENWYRSRREYPTYHLAMCSQLEELNALADDQEYLATSRISEDYDVVKIRAGGEVIVAAHGFVVCKHCLHRLRYKDYDEFRNRRRGYSEKILRDFSLPQFYKTYPQYPLSFGAKLSWF